MKKLKWRKTIYIHLKKIDLYSLSEIKDAIYKSKLSKYKLKKSHIPAILDYIRKEELKAEQFSKEFFEAPLLYLAIRRLAHKGQFSYKKIGRIKIYQIKPIDFIVILETMKDIVNRAELKKLIGPLSDYLTQARKRYKNIKNIVNLGIAKRRKKPAKSNRRIFPDEEE